MIAPYALAWIATMPPRAEPSRLFSPSEVIERLAVLHGLTHDDGTVNYSAVSRRTGIATSTISRIHRGQRDADGGRADSWVLSSDTIQRLMTAFHITFAEASGTAPLPEPGAKRKRGSGRFEPSAADMELLKALRALSPSDRSEVQALIDIKAQLSAARKRNA